MQFAQGDVQLHGHNIFTSHRNYAFICVNLKSQKKTPSFTDTSNNIKKYNNVFKHLKQNVC